MIDGTLKLAFGAAAIAFVAAEMFSHPTHVVLPAGMVTSSSAPGSSQTSRAGDQRPPVTQSASYGRVEITPDRFGQYHAEVEIDGRRLPMLVDTGASFVSLSYTDAAAVGLRPMPSDFNIKMATANGIAAAAAVRLREIRLDTIDVGDVQAIVMPQGVVSPSLLGMSFLKKLGSFEVSAGNLVLKP